jgi:antitoxin CcdA
MQPIQDPQAPKRSTRLDTHADRPYKAQESEIHTSSIREQPLTGGGRERQRGQWLAENQVAIARYNELVEHQGVFSDGLRAF